jgi:hypothetical protein
MASLRGTPSALAPAPLASRRHASGAWRAGLAHTRRAPRIPAVSSAVGAPARDAPPQARNEEGAQAERLRARWLATQRVVLARAAARAAPGATADPGAGAAAAAAGRAALLRILDALAADVSRLAPGAAAAAQIAAGVAALRADVAAAEGVPGEGPGAGAPVVPAGPRSSGQLKALRARWGAARALLALSAPASDPRGALAPAPGLLLDLFEDAEALWRDGGGPGARALMEDIADAWDCAGGAGLCTHDACCGDGAGDGAAAGLVTPAPEALPLHFRIARAAAAPGGAGSGAAAASAVTPSAAVRRVIVADDLALQM